VVGTTPPYLDARAWTIVSGYPFGDSDVRAATRVALIGQTAVDNLFGSDDPLGKTIRIRQSPFVIVGVLGKKGQNLDGRDQDDTVIIPLTTAQRKVFGNPFPGSVRLIMVQATSAEAMPAVEKSMTALLRQRHRIREGQDNDFYLRTLAAAADSAAETTRVMSVLLGAIAAGGPRRPDPPPLPRRIRDNRAGFVRKQRTAEVIEQMRQSRAQRMIVFRAHHDITIRGCDLFR